MTAPRYSLILRTCNADMTSDGGFVWPESGPVGAPDWDPKPECGNGLHGLLWGEGNGGLLNWSADARWLVVKVLTSSIVDLHGKVKYPKGTVVHCGDRLSATTYLLAHGGAGKAVTGAMATAGDNGTANAGDNGTATAGDSGTATAVDNGTATAGDYGTATAGDYGTATAGYYGTATAGYYGTATAGDYGTATAGASGTATAGDNGIIQIRWYDGSRYRVAVGYVGEDGILPDVAYKCDKDGKLVPRAGDGVTAQDDRHRYLDATRVAHALRTESRGMYAVAANVDAYGTEDILGLERLDILRRGYERMGAELRDLAVIAQDDADSYRAMLDRVAP